jgi:hypothetical protein
MTHCPRCNGALTANIDGDLCWWQCGAVIYIVATRCHR